jgi:hypothetical protein
MHGLWQQRRCAPASKLGRRASRISAISRIGIFPDRHVRDGGRSVALPPRTAATRTSRPGLNLPTRLSHDA